MKLLLEGIVNQIKTEQADVYGTLQGLNGPYFDAVPENYEYPYLVISLQPGDTSWNFGSNYLEKCTVTLKVYDYDFIASVGYSDALAAIFDLNRFSISPDRICLALRKESAKPKKEPNFDAKTKKAIYSASITMKYEVQRSV